MKETHKRFDVDEIGNHDASRRGWQWYGLGSVYHQPVSGQKSKHGLM